MNRTHFLQAVRMGRRSGQTKVRRTRQQQFGLVGLVVGCLLPFGAIGAPSQTFNVTVTSQSQQQVQTLGSAAISTAIMQLRSLQRYNHFTRQSQQLGYGPAITGPASSFGFAAALFAAAVSGSELDVDFGRLNSFVNLDYRFGDHDTTANVPAYDFQRFGLLAGVDYRVNPDLVLGASLGYQQYKNDFTNISGHAEMDGWNMAGFGSWYPFKSWYLEAIVRAGFNDYETQRPLIASGGGPNGIAMGDTQGAEYSASLGTGYVFNHKAWTVTPTLRLIYSTVDIDAYRERGTIAGALNYKEQNVDSFTSNLGGSASYTVNTRYGVVLPQVNFEWVHQYEDNRGVIAASNFAAGSFQIPVNAPDENYYRSAIGATMILPHGRILYVYYEAILSLGHKNVNTLTVGGRMEF